MRFLKAACLILVLAGAAGAGFAQIGGPIALGDLPAGKKVRVHFDVTVDTGLGPLVMQVENQGTVTSSTMAFGPVPTDDPADGSSEVDLTVTPLDGLTIGNLVWNEKTGNLVFDPATADVGIDGVLVHLYADDGDGVLDAGDGAPIATDTTAGGGLYSFAGVQPGDYIVEIPPCNFAGGAPCATAPLAGLASLAGAPDPDDDVDNDDNGGDVAGFGVATSAVTLTFGGETPGNEDGDSDADTNLTVDAGFQPVVDLALDKSDGGMNAVAGATYTYTIKITNNGPGASSGSTVTDTLPSGWTFVSSTGTCVADGMSPVETVTCTVGMIASAGMASFDITAMVPASAAAGTVTNSASVVGAQTDLVAGNNSDSEMTTVVVETDLALDKSDSGLDAAAGDTYVYTLEVTNNGPSDSTGGTVTDTLPAGWTFVSATGGTCVGDGMSPVETVTCTVGALAPTGVAAMQTFMVTVSVPSNAAAGTVTNSASVAANETDSTAGNNGDSEMTTVVVETDLELDKSDDGTDAGAGSNYVYTLKVTNNGPSDSTGGTVTDTLPAGWGYVSATGGTCATAAGGFTCTVGALADGAMQTFTVTVSVPASAPAGTVTNSATVTATETDPTAGNDTDTEMTTVVPATDLALDKSDDGTNAVAGSTYSYDIKVTNNGPANSTGGAVTDTLPTGWTYVSATGGTCAAAVGGFTCTVDPLTLSAMQTFTVTVMVPSSATAGTVTNSASVAANENDLVTGNDSDTEMTTVVLETDLALDKSDSGLNVAAGDTYVYTLKVTNNGPSDSTGGTLSDTLPVGWTFVSATGGTCIATATGFDCTVGALATGAMQTFLATVQVPSSAAAGTVTNSASLTANETDSTAGNDSDSEMTTVSVETDLSVSDADSDSGSQATAGESYVYDLKVTNNGPSDSTGGTLSDTLPTGWTFVSATGGTCVATATGFDCTVGALASGAMQTFVVTVSVPSSEIVGTVTNTATVTANETDSTAGNDTSIAMTPVIREVDVVVTKTESVDPVVAGAGLPGNLTYVVTVENKGPSDVTGLSLSEDLTLPAPDVSVDSTTPSAGGFVPTTAPDGTWTLDLPASATETLTVVISVGSTAPFGIDTISNTATATGSTGSETFINTGDDSATESTTISTGPPAFKKVFAPDTIGEGFETTLTFTIDNTMNGLAAADLAFIDVLPPMLRVADTPNVVNTCAGTVTAPAGSVSIELSGGMVAGFGSCELSVSVFAPSTGVLVNTSGDLTSSTGNSGPATDTLTVVGCAAFDGSNLTLGSHVVLVPETYEVCNTIEVEQHFQVLGPNGILELRAGVAVVFFNGVEVAQDGELKVVIDPTLVP